LLRWLVLDLNSFFASCEQQENPDLRGKPIIVVPTMAETTCAIAASYPAKAFGIKTGTLVWEARRLCPDVKLVQAHHQLYVDYHHRILTVIDKHIPVEEVMSIDEVACRLDRKQQDPEIAQKLAHSIKREIQSQVGECLTSSIGISANVLLAKMASNMQKPDGLTI
jgi:DNA polymerase-4